MSVPVQVLEVNLTLPTLIIDGMPTGPNTIHLPPGETPMIVYNSATRRLNTLDDDGIIVEVDNAIQTGSPTRVHLSASILATGEAVLVAQAEQLFDPCPGDLDGTGDVGFTDLLIVLGEWGHGSPVRTANRSSSSSSSGSKSSGSSFTAPATSSFGTSGSTRCNAAGSTETRSADRRDCSEGCCPGLRSNVRGRV